MAGHFKFELVSPERVLLSANVEQVMVPGADGDFTVLAGHAPVVSTLRSGVIEAKLADGRIERFTIETGLAEVDPTSVTILATTASGAPKA
jgi:F-type H+-transporting ATPase subunit epsilon